MSKDVNCPYCGKWSSVCRNDGFGTVEDENYEMQCDCCDKYFILRTSIIFSYDSRKADCLNDGNHDYQITRTNPRECSKMRCSMCFDERELTEEERKLHGIGTLKEYFESIKNNNENKNYN